MTCIYYVCPGCRASRMHHGLCCGCWPTAVDLDDDSVAGLIALMAIDVIHGLAFKEPDPQH